MRKWTNRDRDFYVELTNDNGDIVPAKITLDGVSRLIAIPDLTDAVSPIATNMSIQLDSSKHLRIDNQEYIGSIKSIATDNVVDVYYISRKYDSIVNSVVDDQVVSTPTTATEDFFLIIPSTIFLGEYGKMPNDDTIEIQGIVSGVDDLFTSTDGFDSSIVRLDKDITIATYLSDETVDFTNANMYLNSYILPGLTTDNILASTIIKDSDGVFISNFGATQIIVLENAKSMFPNLEKLLLSKIKNKLFSSFKFSNKVYHSVDDYNIAIPLNF